MKLSIVIIGDEILLGRVTDTNSGLIARTFAEAGWDVVAVHTCGDSRESINTAVEDALAEADLVVSTGGLGPTRDDITKNVLMGFFGGELRHDDAVLENIEAVFRKKSLELNPLTRAQAMVPDSCRVIQNTVGTAPIMWFEADGKVLVAMPGVPAETRFMLPEVARQVQKHFKVVPSVVRREITVSGISESALAERLASFEDSMPQGYKLAYLPGRGEIVLRLEGSPADFDAKFSELKAAVGPYFKSEGKSAPAELAIAAARARSLTVGTAESCTGGNIASLITSIAGASDVFKGAVISYSNSVKSGVLGVSEETLAHHGAVSEATVIEMAEGARRVLGCDFAVATSGIAGPGGGTAEKPVGTVWTAIAGPRGTKARLLQLNGDRRAVIDRASSMVLLGLVAEIEAQSPSREAVETLFEDGDLEAAEAMLQNITSPELRPWALYLLGRIAWKRGQKSRAISFYAEAAGLDPAGEGATALEQARAIMDFFNKDLYNP